MTVFPFDDEIKIGLLTQTPRLLLHGCCAPCASSVLEVLSPFFEITVLYYNPNIRPTEEYEKRAAEFCKLIKRAEYPNKVDPVICDYDAESFGSLAALYPDEPEGGLRCKACYSLRLAETFKRARGGGYDFFATTLSVSPHKNAALLNEIGNALAEGSDIRFLSADFKKRDGYKRSIELSKQYGLYRQAYCGCKLS